jgi:hypothetical protein
MTARHATLATIWLTVVLGTLPTPVEAQALGSSPYLPGSVMVRQERVAVFREPTGRGARRGVAAGGNRLPAYRFAEGPGCRSWWVEVYAAGWICGDYLSASALAPDAPALPVLPEDQLTPFPCAFAREGGAPIFDRLSDSQINWSDRWLEEGWAIAVRRRTYYDGERFYGTAGGDYVRASEVYLARPSAFHGEELAAGDEVGWTHRPSTRLFDQLPGSGGAGSRSIGPQKLLRFVAEHDVDGTGYLQLADGEGYVRASDVRRPEYTSPPEDVGPYDVWFDVDRDQQLLVVYRGEHPIYTTLVSSGRRGHTTPAGTFHI